jgi:ribose transport system permease protein
LINNKVTPTIPGANKSAAAPNRLRRFLSARETGVFIALLLMCLFLSMTTPVFLAIQNLLNVGRQVSLLGVMAVGMSFVLIGGEIDLSIGSTYALCGLATGMLLLAGWGILPAILAGLALGALVGFVNGWLSTFGRLPSFITTLGMLNVVRGIALLITNGNPVTINEQSKGLSRTLVEQFYFLGQGRVLGIPMQLVFFIVVALIGWFILSRTIFGFRIYAVGGSPKAARVSGISVNNTKVTAFMIMGLLSGLAGILSLAFLPSGQAGRTGVGLELDVIAATVVGGASLSGGEGTMVGTVLGVFIVGVLRNGLVLLGISPFWQTTIIGAVIILAVGVDKWTRARRTQ